MSELRSDNDREEFVDPLANYDPKEFSDPLERALHDESVAEIKATPFECISPETTIQRAVELLASLNVACLLVSENEQLVGVFSDRDVLDRVALEYEAIKSHPVREVMTSNPIYVYESDSAAAALAVMAASGYRHVPLVDLDNHPVGIVSPQRVLMFLRKHLAKE